MVFFNLFFLISFLPLRASWAVEETPEEAAAGPAGALLLSSSGGRALLVSENGRARNKGSSPVQWALECELESLFGGF